MTMMNPCYFELAFSDIEACRKFYTDTFGWTFTKMDLPIDYWDINVGQSKGEAIPVMGLGMMKSMSPEHRVVMYINVEDIEAHTNKVKENGGKIIDERKPVPSWGWFQFCQDPDGTMFALWQNDKSAA